MIGFCFYKRLYALGGAYAFCKIFYRFGGKALLALCGKMNILPSIVTRAEKDGKMQTALRRMPNALAALALDQYRQLQQINDHRRKLTVFYMDQLRAHNIHFLAGVRADVPLQKFPLFVEHAERIRQTLKKRHIYLHDGWTGCVICPANADCEAVGYKDGDDPKADMAGRQILSLPTHPSMTLTQAQHLVDLLIPLLHS